jgi:hypothetical protein
VIGNPFPLKQNADKSFQGSIVLGKGFVLTPEEAEALITKDPRNKEVLFPYLNGDDLNNDPEQKPSRWVINFFDWSEEKARTYPDCFEIIERLVKPERFAYDESKNSWNKSVKANWWLFGAWRKALDMAMSRLDQVMAISEVTKYVSFVFVPVDVVFMHTLKIISYSNWSELSILNSSIYSEWAWKYSSTMGSGTLRYTPSTSFETFPFKSLLTDDYQPIFDLIGSKFYTCRKKIMEHLQLGLTKTYNLLHEKELKQINEDDIKLDDKSFVERYGKKALQFRKHLQNISTLCYNEIIEQLEELRSLQIQIDKTVLDLYGWSDVQLRHGFYEQEYLPEHDRVRFTIHPEARRELLKRLLKLNHHIHIEDMAESSSGYQSVKRNKNAKGYPSHKLF